MTINELLLPGLVGKHCFGIDKCINIMLTCGRARGGGGFAGHTPTVCWGVEAWGSKCWMNCRCCSQVEVQHQGGIAMAATTRAISVIVTSASWCCGLQEYSDAMLSLMMSTITKGLYSVNDMVDKYNVAYDKLGRRRTPL